MSLTDVDLSRETLDGLKKRGFKLTFGEDGSGFLLLVWARGGGYYLGMISSWFAVIRRVHHLENRCWSESANH